ncbi:uncharacterized protein LOC120647006 [Panicum virgatum]|uniref:C2 domain-containing protein n=1 Tax=Panicum virgatum TaxID=38727 RepID=A0A8T0NZF1_PANVG|nr:uncharacterized protein LOC120647006 [Panicum virgatum]XP_039779532.1 uncharacterized protein LOC120647006 [Panicum virgatum]KAG2554096.1 hypothetical protein PVAP13_9KG641800 [Panicum virgatum]KAG2554097.1 hypothetical protein PVAP13_9KG641800 [Panicum virgatum]KAG2554098.1 hypothetical protein PVAP13_9KG641800 [Panicum virgatum]
MADYQTSLVTEPQLLNNEIITQKATNNFVSDTARKDKSIGYLDVFVHQARDIHNVCIYHKQDVYAKLCLTSSPDVSCSTKVINSAGRNPVFDESLQLDVQTVDASLKCEIWMLSRIRNYLEDQLLGFALVPLADIVMGNGKLVQEFSLTSTDLFHTPAGFVQLSLSYAGCSPDIILMSSPNKSVSRVADSGNDCAVPSQIEKIEFPDLNVVKEDEVMVSKYLEMGSLDSENPIKPENGKLLHSGNDNDIPSELGKVDFPDSENGRLLQFHAAVPGTAICADKLEEHQDESPLSCVSTTGSSTALSATRQSVSETSSEPLETTVGASPRQRQKEKSQDVTDGEADSSEAPPRDEFVQPMISINLQPEQSVVQQDIVDMYMKSMQQFTESLAKMKLPLDVENSSPSNDDCDSSTIEKSSPSPSASLSKGSRVFYGSRAFF